MPVSFPSTHDVYNRLDAREEPAVVPDVHRNHYDHFNDPAGSAAVYNRLGATGSSAGRGAGREDGHNHYDHFNGSRGAGAEWRDGAGRQGRHQ